MAQSSSQSQHIYRPEIDGLRALAVLAVIIYHLNPAWLPGGFTGVDVFFVISGYLITLQIQDDLNANQFSLKTFYLRRIRRILPALLLVLMVCAVAAWIWLTPEDLRSFAKSLLVQPLFLQNVLFLSEGEYFIAAQQKPLLHTWSLAVEEQFYVFWPLLMLFLFRHGLKLLPVFGLIVISFLINVSWSASSSELAFFTILSRTWELALGGMLALLERQHPRVLRIHAMPARLALTMGWLGLAASFVLLNSRMMFPGYVALIPVLATCILIAFSGQSASFYDRVLSSQALVKIGLLSYALYLWHWPVLVFMRHLGWQTNELPGFVTFWALTVGWAYASTHWIEQPIRKRKLLATTKSLLIATGVGFVILTAIALHFMFSNGASYRYEPNTRSFLTARIDSRNWRCTPWAIIKDANPSICEAVMAQDLQQPPKKVLVWGDSHASMWMPMLEQLAHENNASLYLNKKNCRPVSLASDCAKEHQAKVMARIEQMQLTDVILASFWQDIHQPDLAFQLEKQVQWLRQKNIKVWLVVDTPSNVTFDPLAAYASQRTAPKFSSMPFKQYNESRRLPELKLFDAIQAQSNEVKIIDATDVYCNDQSCFSGQGMHVWYRDATHLSNAGAVAAKHKFSVVFKRGAD